MTRQQYDLIVSVLLNGKKADRQKAWEEIASHHLNEVDDAREQVYAESRQLRQDLENERKARKFDDERDRNARAEREVYVRENHTVREALAEAICQCTSFNPSLKIQNIKDFCMLTGFGLRESKDAIDEVLARHKTPDLSILA